jgi:DNA-binding MarR family transcriptional regulator
MDLESQRDLQLLEAVSGEQRLTQRSLADRLGIAVGLTNLYLKRLARKGYIKFVNVRPNRIVYLLTPRGITEKSRLTYEFMENSLSVYRQARMHLSTMVLPGIRASQGVALFGTGEAAELAYLCLREHGREPIAIFDRQPGQFLGMPVHDIRDHASVAFEVMIVARLDRPEGLLAELTALGIASDRLVSLRPPTPAVRSRIHKNGKKTIQAGISE